MTRDELGKVVRDAWIRWASQQPDPKPDHLVPWEYLDERNREVDRRIGAAVEYVVRHEIAAMLLGGPMIKD